MTWYGGGSGGAGPGTPGGATAANQPGLAGDGGSYEHVTNFPAAPTGYALDASIQSLITSVKTGMTRVIAQIPASDGMTHATISGVTLPGVWNLFVNGQEQTNGTDYTVSTSSGSTTITFLAAMGFSIAATDILTIQN